MSYKPYCDCGKPVENQDTGLCSSCNKLRRIQDRAKAAPEPKPIAKVSQGKAKELQQYAKLRQKFLLNKWCAYHGRPCLPTDVHHAAGRDGVNEKGIPRLLDVENFVPLCREAHEYIERNPKWAKENNFSENRLV
jgi:hypothetical protein